MFSVFKGLSVFALVSCRRKSQGLKPCGWSLSSRHSFYASVSGTLKPSAGSCVEIMPLRDKVKM